MIFYDHGISIDQLSSPQPEKLERKKKKKRPMRWG